MATQVEVASRTLPGTYPKLYTTSCHLLKKPILACLIMFQDLVLLPRDVSPSANAFLFRCLHGPLTRYLTIAYNAIGAA